MNSINGNSPERASSSTQDGVLRLYHTRTSKALKGCNITPLQGFGFFYLRHAGLRPAFAYNGLSGLIRIRKMLAKQSNTNN